MMSLLLVENWAMGRDNPSFSFWIDLICDPLQASFLVFFGSWVKCWHSRKDYIFADLRNWGFKFNFLLNFNDSQKLSVQIDRNCS